MSETTDDARQTEAEAKVEEAIQRVRPLNATQSRYLLKLVDNDFAQLRAEITEMADEQRKAKLKEISEGASAEQLKAFGDRAYAVLSQYHRDRDDLIREAKAQGITLTMPSMGASGVQTSDDELQNKIRRINAEHDSELRTVINVLNRKKLEAERKVMIATITTATEDILHAIPDARTLMLEAAQERAQRQADASKQLTSGTYNPQA